MKRKGLCLIALAGALTSAGVRAELIHWSYQPLPQESVGSIDQLIDKRLAREGLSRSPRATPERLLRRLHLLLVGLPPTPAELKAFQNDPSSERYRRVVDNLLARPGFGERWGRHWLDLARYADSSGLHQDGDRPHAWRYRDYVIKSFNDDKSYGRFVEEQLAGDLVAPGSAEAWIATGFCRTAPSNEENVGLAEFEAYRFDQLDGIVSTVGSVFLGHTIGCARCHDHKSEPLLARDYYAMVAAFRNTSATFVPLNDNTMGSPSYLRLKVRQAPKVPKGPGIRALSELPMKEWKMTHVLARGNVHNPGEEVGAGIPGVLRHLPARYRPIESKGRLALARWIASPENALTWRVMANRVWQHLFGQGLVPTPSNLGKSGEPPLHPELLEHLAVSLRDDGGRVKALVREICLSKTFQQDSRYLEESHRIDQANAFYWRYPRHRLEAEAIRDSILFASGKLNRKMGGPGFKPRVPREILTQSMRNRWPDVKKENERHWRRSVYIYQKRQLLVPLLELLDVPDASESCAVRFESTTPTQALALLNDAFVNDQAGFLAERVAQESDPILRMFDLVWGRSPSKDDLAQARQFVAKSHFDLSDLGVVLFNSSAFIYVE